MASLEFALSERDKPSIADAVRDAGLSVIWNHLYEVRTVHLETSDTLRSRDRASVYLTKPQWIFGEFDIQPHINKLTGVVSFDLRPRVNFYALSFSYYPSRDDNGVVRLGFGDIDSFPTWLKTPGSELVSAPSDARFAYRNIVERLKKSSRMVSAGRRRILILPHALEEYVAGRSLMPHQWLDEAARLQLQR